ncbi:MAG: amino acid adenylation domain-containing protein, partial [Acidobacteriota bacterium]
SHVYGPTEATTFATYLHLEGVPEDAASVPIGGPLANTTVHVADRWGRPAPAHVPGELLLGGDGLAMGYHARPAITAASFVPDPDGDGGRLYRTGDLVRLLADGSIDFMGRIDHQVKIRGFRIELGEVDAALAEQPGVTESITVVQGTGADQRLVAFTVVDSGADAPTAAELRDALSRRLPEFAVPTVHLMDALPLNANGKVDRKALPEVTAVASAESTTLPRDAMEEMVEAAFAEVLDLDSEAGRLDIHTDFFSLGGHSLLATRLTSRLRDRLGVEVALREIFHQPTVAALARRLAELRSEDSGTADLGTIEPLSPSATDGGSPLSFAQQRMWFLQAFDRRSSAYNMPFTLHLRGDLDPDAMERAIRELVSRHRILRTRYAEDRGTGEVRQWVDDVPAKVLVRHDLSMLAADTREDRAVALLRSEAERPFDLAADPALRAHLVSVGADDHRLLLVMHHIACDGASWGILRNELGILYAAFRDGAEISLGEPTLQYADFAAWQRDRLSGDELERQTAFWRRTLADTEPLALMGDRPRPEVFSHRGKRLTFTFSPELSTGLRQLARGSGGTLYLVLLAGLQTLLHRFTGQAGISVGAPVAGRRRSELEGMVGMFVDTVVLRTDLSGDPSFEDLLERVRDVALDAFAHQDVPFETLVDALAPERDPSRTPLFQVGFQLLDGVQVEAKAMGGLDVADLPAPTPSAKSDLDLNVVDDGSALSGSLIYYADLFERSTVEGWLRSFETLLTAAVAGPRQRLSQLPTVDPSSRDNLLGPISGTTSDYPRDASLAELFAGVVEDHGDRPAVAGNDGTLTYAELAERADRWASCLVSLGVGPETPVALLMDRGVDLVTAMVAVIHAGGAYVPLDGTYPEDRLAYMIEDTGAAVVLAQEHLLDRLPAAGDDDGPTVLCVDRDRGTLDAGGDSTPLRGATLLPDAGPHQAAYITYTSGSTGRPKGVVTPHRGVVRLIRGNNYYPIQPDDRIAHAANISFDPTTFQVWGALLSGACVVPVDRDVVLSPRRLTAAIGELGITVLDLPTALFHQLVEHGTEALGALRVLNFGGERCEPSAVRAALGAGIGRLLNHYGPTEATTSCTFHRVTDVPEDAASVPIGLPLANDTAHVVDRWGRLAAPGAAGELWVGGDGLARGYLGRAALTAAAFVPDPFSEEPGRRLYRTGDLVRRRPGGELDFLGRIDQQVKLRGFRIELGEIEAALGAHPEVAAALVMLRDDGPGGTDRLVAYAERQRGAEADPEALRSWLAGRMPEPMVPSAVVVLDAFPLTPNEKVDRDALPIPDAPEQVAYRAPETDAQRTLAEVWTSVLGVEKVGLDDGFFALGGDSILVIQTVSRAYRAGLDLEPRHVFLHPTLEALAAVAKIVEPEVSSADDEPSRDPSDGPIADQLDEGELESVLADLDLD